MKSRYPSASRPEHRIRGLREYVAFKMTIQWLQNASATLITSLVVAIATALITVRLALKRFRSERWWERKADTYSRIVESLCHLKAYSDAKIPEYLKSIEYSDERKKALSDDYTRAYNELTRIIAIGAYIICDEAAAVLDELWNRPRLDWAKNPPWEIFEADSNAYQDTLKKMRDIAKKDLGVR